MNSSLLAPERIANVMLIDDRRADVELTRVYLQVRDRMRFNLMVAHGAMEALAMLQHAITKGEIIDLLMVDINMPGMDGFEFLQSVRLDPGLKHLAAVMCTGSTYDQDLVRARELGAAGYMVKPPSLEQFRQVIAELPDLCLEEASDEVRLLRAA